MMDYCLKQIAYDEETGTIDIDRIAISTSRSETAKRRIVMELIEKMEEKSKDKLVDREELLEKSKEVGLDEYYLERIIKKLKKDGIIFAPKRGFLKKI